MKPVAVPEVIPIFPLIHTVLLPGELMPLHIFERRYRDMVRDVLASHRIIGMVQIEGEEGVPESLESMKRPPIREVGCAGIIARHHELTGGRYLIWLLGVQEFRVAEELQTLTRYRQVRIDPLFTEGRGSGSSVESLRFDLLAALPLFLEGAAEKVVTVIQELAKGEDDQLIVVAAMALGLGPEAKQALLEARSIPERFRLLKGFFEERLNRRPVSLRLDPARIN